MQVELCIRLKIPKIDKRLRVRLVVILESVFSISNT